MRLFITAVLGGLLCLYGNTQPLQGSKVYYGLLHAHTYFSDGSGTPAEAYRMAKTAGLHFFAVTEHNHAEAEAGAKERKDGIMIATNPALYNGNSNQTITRRFKVNGQNRTETVTVSPLIKSASEASEPQFQALYGQEFSTISSSNHVNVLGVREVLTVPNGDFRQLVDALKRSEQATGVRPMLQFNHPDIQKDLFYTGNDPKVTKVMFNDYGIDEGDLGPHFKDLVAALDPYVHLIEILSGPAMGEEVIGNHYYRDANENDYFFYLKQGFHISPSAGQDNHYKTWGTITDARTGILAQSLSEAAVFDAFRRNRTFATEDKNLDLVLLLGDSVMGSSVTIAEETELDFKIRIHDADEPNAKYLVEIFGGDIKPELSTNATNWKQRDALLENKQLTGNGTYSIKNIFATDKPSFYYAKITQQNADGGSNRAWTAPIWVNDGRTTHTGSDTTVGPQYYWTSAASSRVYHLKGCSAISRIKPENLQSGNTPPAGRTQHTCNVSEEEE